MEAQSLFMENFSVSLRLRTSVLINLSSLSLWLTRFNPFVKNST